MSRGEAENIVKQSYAPLHDARLCNTDVAVRNLNTDTEMNNKIKMLHIQKKNMIQKFDLSMKNNNNYRVQDKSKTNFEILLSDLGNYESKTECSTCALLQKLRDVQSNSFFHHGI
jgi:hypothetical protein